MKKETTKIQWVNLLEEKPPEAGEIYKVVLIEYDGQQHKTHLRWDGEGFVPLEEDREFHGFHLDVTHWLKYKTPEVDADEVWNYVIRTQVLFQNKEDPARTELARQLIFNNNIEVLKDEGYCFEIVVDGVNPILLRDIRALCVHNNEIYKTRK